MNIKYCFFKSKNINPIIIFFSKYYKKHITKDSANWEFKENPFGKAKIIVAKFNKKIIAAGVAIPLIIYFKNKKEKIYRIQNVLVDDNFRKRGIFQNILKKFDNYFKNKKIKIISFPNESSLKAFINNGWEKILNISFLIKKVKKNYKSNQVSEFKRIKKFELRHQNLFKNTKKTSLIDINCSKNYLNWRFLSNKRTKFECYEILEKEKIKAIVIVKKYKFNNLKICQLCLQISHEKFFPKIIDFCLNYCVKNKLSLFALWSNQYTKYLILNFGFKQIFQKQRYLIVNNFQNKIAKKINLAMHYSDVF